MANIKNKHVVIPTLLLLASSYLRKKENRQKIKNMWNDFQNKIPFTKTSYQHSFKELAETAASADTTKIQENNFISEGGSQTALAYYNEHKQKVK